MKIYGVRLIYSSSSDNEDKLIEYPEGFKIKSLEEFSKSYFKEDIFKIKIYDYTLNNIYIRYAGGEDIKRIFNKEHLCVKKISNQGWSEYPLGKKAYLDYLEKKKEIFNKSLK